MRNSPHIIALDLDGTLLNRQKEITDRTKSILQKIKAAGHIVVICTGRSFRSSIDYYEELQLDSPIVNVNGAHIHHPKNPEWNPIHHPIPLDTAHQLIEACYEMQTNNIFAEALNGFYMETYDDQITHIYASFLQKTKCFVGNIRTSLDEAPLSIIVNPQTHNANQLFRYLNEKQAVQYRVLDEAQQIIEITKHGINKAFGLKKVADAYGISHERIIAFGDESNDLEMLKYAGIGVAMGNASEELKAVADHVTVSNEQDGIAFFLSKYFGN